MALVSFTEVGFSYEGNLVISGIDFELEAGDYLCVVGENGSGKTTLVRGLLGLLKPSMGSIEFSEGLKPTQIAYLPQQSVTRRNFPASVDEVVLSGRLARKGLLPFYSKEDRVASARALQSMGIGHLAPSPFGELSGGQQQRVLLARALCSASDGMRLLVLDEPMSSLDPHVKQSLYSLIQELNRQQGIAILMVTHDIQTATNQASHILLLDRKQEFFGTAHAFMHTGVGQELMRDSCGGHCAICGLALGSEEEHRH